jgi:hypothetical protein
MGTESWMGIQSAFVFRVVGLRSGVIRANVKGFVKNSSLSPDPALRGK